MFKAFKLLARFKSLRGGKFDIFGKTAERKMERQLIAEYFATIDELLGRLDHDNHALAVQIAAIPEQIRGYGHIKDANVAKAATERDTLLAAWRNPQAARAAA
jgi:indolepyruvate ferredoxin oxidoreductase